MKMSRRALKLTLIAVTILAALLGTVLAESKAPDEEWTDYAGHVYAGTDPWEGQLSIAIEAIEHGRMRWNLTDDLGWGTTLQTHAETELTDGVSAFHITGSVQENEDTTFDYAGTIALSGGDVIVTFAEGELTEHSAEGGSTAHHVAALDDDARTVVLRKVVPGGVTEAA